MIKDKYDWVKDKLTQYPVLRDSTERLYYIYLLEIDYDVNKPFKQVLKDMEARIIPYIDSFGRASRKVQEEHPHLRGKLYNKRKRKQEEVKQEIKDI
ncbi:MAG: hypothetical protein RLZZ196_1262 [Bacteroidota bacterium]|jgi:hypothetical protein